MAALALSFLIMALGGGPSSAASAVNLGTAGSFGVLAGSTVTNTGDSVISGDLGVSPGTAVSGFPPGQVLGTIHSADAVASQAKSDLVTAYDAVAAQSPSETISADLGGRTLTSGVFNSATTLGLTGELTLDAQGDAGAVFIFQAGTTLITATGSSVILVNGAQACNVYWQVGSSATLGSGSTFVGTVLAMTSISAGTGATIDGALLARTGAVTLDDNTITTSACLAPTTDIPTSDLPTSDLPTSDLPTSDLPTSDLPTSDLPTSDLPTSDLPTSDLPTSDLPTSDLPTSDLPTSDLPTSDLPTTDLPTTDLPTTDLPTTDLPTTDLPTTDGPKVPIVNNPATDKPSDQVSTIPEGVPNTGDGGSLQGTDTGLLWAGTLILGMAGASLMWWGREGLTS